MTTTTATLTGGHIVSRAIQDQGVRTVFALGGEAHYTTLDALHQDGVRIVSTRHETATVAAADGYARTTGKIGVALILPCQGLANAIGGIGSAFEACSPVLVLIGQPNLAPDEPGRLQDADEVAMARSVTKWVRTVHDGRRIGEYVETACRYAVSGRPGPVVLSIPIPLLAAAVEAGVEPAPPTTPIPPSPADEAVERAAELIAGASRPLIVAGSGATKAKAGPVLGRLATEFRLPVAGDALGRGLVPEDMESGFPWPLMDAAAAEADVAVIAGARLDRRRGFGRPPRFSPDAEIIQINVDPHELGRNRYVGTPIMADVRLALQQIADRLKAKGYRGAGDSTWIREAMAPKLDQIDALGQGDDGMIHPNRMARELMAQLPKNAIVVQDGADVFGWFRLLLRIHEAPGYMDHQPFGSMGIGTPMAIGGAAGARELAVESGDPLRPVVLVTGDGSFGFYEAEWHSAARERLPIVCLISNDGAWGTEKHFQMRMIGRSVNTELGTPRYHLVALAYGCYGEQVESPTEVGPAISRAFAANGPAVLNFLTDPEAGSHRLR